MISRRRLIDALEDEFHDADDEDANVYEFREEAWEDEEDEDDEDMNITGGGHDNLYPQLIEEFSTIPRMKNADLDEWGVVNAAPAVVPNPYTPSFRIFSYNITAVGDSYQQDVSEDLPRSSSSERRAWARQENCQGQKAETWKCKLDKDWHSDAKSPSRKNRMYTPIGFAQVRGKGLETFIFILSDGCLLLC